MRRDPLDADRVERVAGRRDELRLGALAADERDLGALSPQRVGHRDGRHHVPGRPARRDHDPRSAHRPPSRARRADRAQVARAAARHVEQQAHRHQQRDERRRAGRDERQRHAGQRREPEHGVDVEQRLAQDQRGQAGREQLRVRAPRGLRGPQPGVPDHAVQGEQAADPRQARAPRR